MTEILRGYKFIEKDGTSRNGNAGKWVKNRWKRHAGKVELCSRGFHACLTPSQALSYVYGVRFCVVEAKGKIVHSEGDKFVASEMRVVEWLPAKEIFVEYAIKCAWRALKHYENKYPSDKRVRKGLLAAKRWLKNPTEENRAAYAAYAAYAAVDAAAYAAYAAYAAVDAAACAAARAAAYAACAAARAAEERWQERTLQKIIDKHL